MNYVNIESGQKFRPKQFQIQIDDDPPVSLVQLGSDSGASLGIV